MLRAFVGFSGPIGYDYANKATATQNDLSSSPNPILYGTMGLFTLYDEIWFACESLCPENMRALPYVKFLDRERGALSLSDLKFKDEVQTASNNFPAEVTLEDLFEGPYTEGMREYLSSEEIAVDNHSHGLKFYDQDFTGNLGARQLAADIWLVSKFNKNYNFELVLNPLTAKIAFDAHTEVRNPTPKKERYVALEVAERVISVTSLYDIVGLGGPYHPCVEELREDATLRDFRAWLGNLTTRFDNLEIRDVEADVNRRVAELKLKAIDKFVEPDKLRNIPIDLIKDKIAGLDPAITPIRRVLDYFDRNSKVKNLQWQAFIAKARTRLDLAKQS